MKNMNVTHLIVFVCLFVGCIACKNEDAGNQEDGNQPSKPEPVGIILKSADNLPGLEIAAVLFPRADEQSVAESLSVAFYDVRKKCIAELEGTDGNVVSIPGLSIFNGKLSAQNAGAETNPAVRCLKTNLHGVTLSKLKAAAHTMDIQLRVQKVTP